jgi:hypothetical protein
MNQAPTSAFKKLLRLLTSLLSLLKKALQVFTILLRYLWLMFPACFFLYGAYALFWDMSQGKDLLISSLESQWRVTALWIAVVFWVLTTWYSSRILVYKKEDLFNCGDEIFNKKGAANKPVVAGFGFEKHFCRIPAFIGLHMPRLLGYLCFSIIMLAYWQLPVLNARFSLFAAILLLVLNIALYFVFGHFIKRIGNAIKNKGRRFLVLSFWLVLVLFILTILTQYILAGSLTKPEVDYNRQATVVILLTFFIQQMFLYVVVNRTLLMNDQSDPCDQMKLLVKKETPLLHRLFYKVLCFVKVRHEERTFFLLFNFISIVAICIYLLSVFNIRIAMALSSANLALLAFGILVGYFGLVSIFSIHFRINFHIIILLLVIIVGYRRESHYVRILDKPAANIVKERPTLETHFLNWAQHNKAAIENTKDSFPVFFVIADGGASRSGYWVASVLGKLHDETGGAFNEHLFCLSGASGGSVGNGTYFNLLVQQSKGLKGTGFQNDGQQFLKQDFLSYTLARMLGPDFFRPIIPFINLKNIDDRAGALEMSMEEGIQDDNVFLARKFDVPFSSLIPDTNNRLPLLCINTTRMQDGRPGVISNVKLEERIFGKRIDVIGLLAKDKDIRLSTAMVMGARFPFVSPAGRIDEELKEKNDPSKDSTAVHYFVDGGYFDNSGAGVVHEMIIGLQEIIKSKRNDTAYNYLNRLKFVVVHITNSPVGGSQTVDKVHPLSNDLMAPLTTIVGSYGTQTDVNNSRLQRHLELTYQDSTHYQLANLYYGDTSRTKFPMNWSISDYYLKKMNHQLSQSEQVKNLISYVKKLMQ